VPLVDDSMTWGELFERAGSVDTTVGEIRETLAERRERREGGKQ
jgi:hypothetical protein